MSSIFKSANTAIITGGASGIGLALAKKCAGYGMKVLVADFDKNNLDAVPARVGPNASTFYMDVSKLEDWAGLKAQVEKEFSGKINLLALNAGVGGQTSLLTDDANTTSTVQKIINTNIFGVINGLTTLVPVLKAQSSDTSSAIVVTGSKQGITNPPGNPAYNASKSAVKTLAEHLSYDLRSTPNMSVHLLVPGWTWTGLAGGVAGADKDDDSKKPDAPWWPEQVVDYLETKMTERQFWVICPDNEVTEEVDGKRMQWTAGDALYRRPPLSRWRDEYKDEFVAFMAKDA